MSELRFSSGHLWVSIDGEKAELGLTEYFQEHLGEITAVELPDVGDAILASRGMGRVESDLAASLLEGPFAGEVLEVNGEVLLNPDLINQESPEAPWLLRVRIEDASELDDLLSEEEYAELTTEV